MADTTSLNEPEGGICYKANVDRSSSGSGRALMDLFQLQSESADSLELPRLATHTSKADIGQVSLTGLLCHVMHWKSI